MPRNPTDKTIVYLPNATAFAEATVTLGTNEALTDHFTAAQVDQADFAYIEPHANAAWVKFAGGNPGVNDGHQIAANEIRQIDQNESLDLLKITGTGACTITLWKY